MLTDAARFKQELLGTPSAVDRPGTHSEFVGKTHGIKVNFDGIPYDSTLFNSWVDLSAQAVVGVCKTRGIETARDLSRVVLLSVANGTNRLVGPVAGAVGHNVVPVLTHKTSPRSVGLEPDSAAFLRDKDPMLVIAMEDAATAGTTSATAVTAAREAGVRRVGVLNTFQRRPCLEELVAIDTPWESIIVTNEFPTYPPEVCQDIGYCAAGWTLNGHA